MRTIRNNHYQSHLTNAKRKRNLFLSHAGGRAPFVLPLQRSTMLMKTDVLPRLVSLCFSPPRRKSRSSAMWLRRGIVFGAVAGLAVAVPAIRACEAIVPTATLSLFNGRDLSSFESWLPGTGRSDPDKVFTVVDNIDGAPAIRSSGQHFGGLITREKYRDYKLVVEFRWGAVTWKPRIDRARDNGILLHCQGEPGNASKTFDSPWIQSVEFQIIEGGTGDIILVGGFDPATTAFIPTELTVAVMPGTKYWNPAGTPTRFNKSRINWEHRDPAWKDVLGVRGPKDVEKPVGEWNRLEAICQGGNVIYFVNGVKVNEGTDGSLTEGRLLFQSEGAEIFFRRIELHPLPSSQ